MITKQMKNQEQKCCSPPCLLCRSRTFYFFVNCSVITSECWRKQKAEDKQAPTELENIPAVTQTRTGWVCSQKSSQERKQSLLLQEKGQLVSEATKKPVDAWTEVAPETNLEKIAPWKVCPQEQEWASCALAGHHMQARDDWDTTVQL